jgi:hypothetical protein
LKTQSQQKFSSGGGFNKFNLQVKCWGA